MPGLGWLGQCASRLVSELHLSLSGAVIVTHIYQVKTSRFRGQGVIKLLVDGRAETCICSPDHLPVPQHNPL